MLQPEHIIKDLTSKLNSQNKKQRNKIKPPQCLEFNLF